MTVGGGVQQPVSRWSAGTQGALLKAELQLLSPFFEQREEATVPHKEVHK